MDVSPLLHHERYRNADDQVPNGQDTKSPADTKFRDEHVQDGRQHQAAHTCTRQNETERKATMMIEVQRRKCKHRKIVQRGSCAVEQRLCDVQMPELEQPSAVMRLVRHTCTYLRAKACQKDSHAHDEKPDKHYRPDGLRACNERVDENASAPCEARSQSSDQRYKGVLPLSPFDVR